MFAMKSIDTCNDLVNYDEITNTMITSLSTYVLNIFIHKISQEYIKLSRKNNTI